MDMGQDSVDISGQPPAGQPGQPGQPGQGTIFCITVADGKVTMEQYPAGEQPTGEAQPTDLRTALRMVMDAYEKSQPAADQDAFNQGFGKPGEKPSPKTPVGREESY